MYFVSNFATAKLQVHYEIVEWQRNPSPLFSMLCAKARPLDLHHPSIVQVLGCPSPPPQGIIMNLPGCEELTLFHFMLYFAVEMRKYFPASSFQDPEVEPGTSIVYWLYNITRF